MNIIRARRAVRNNLDPTPFTSCKVDGSDATKADGAGMASYYEAQDLKKFGAIGEHAGKLAEQFFKYYNEATGTDGALTRREKALIALAVSHAQKCPYCIDAYTTQCLETGASPEQMMEAVHVAAVMQAGITLVHSVQMQNHLNKLVL
jgi:alkylhydroperoxidase/carboxymuconolactone decarboxylase family protein